MHSFISILLLVNLGLSVKQVFGIAVIPSFKIEIATLPEPGDISAGGVLPETGPFLAINDGNLVGTTLEKSASFHLVQSSSTTTPTDSFILYTVVDRIKNGLFLTTSSDADQKSYTQLVVSLESDDVKDVQVGWVEEKSDFSDQPSTLGPTAIVDGETKKLKLFWSASTMQIVLDFEGKETPKGYTPMAFKKITF